LKGDHLRIISAKFGGPLLKLCPSAPSYIQDGRHY
jgi:hypothetical protein